LRLGLGGQTSLAFLVRLQLGSQTRVALNSTRLCLSHLFCGTQLLSQQSYLFELLFDSLCGRGALAARSRHGGKSGVAKPS